MLSQSFQLPEKQRRGRSRTYVHHVRLHVSKNDGIFNVVEVRMVGFKKQQGCILICLCIDKHQCDLYKGIPSFPIQGDSPIAVKTDTGYSHPFSLLLPCSEASTKIEVAQEMAG